MAGMISIDWLSGKLACLRPVSSFSLRYFWSHSTHKMNELNRLTVMCGCLAPALLSAQTNQPVLYEASILQPVVVTGAAVEQRRWLLPATIDIVAADEVSDGKLEVNVSESLGRVPGLHIEDRHNYAQDLQMSVRGYGARSSFGVRGVRLYVDGIPASAPDGQGQASNFPLGIAQRIEVIRGPYAALYGSSAGGVLSLYTADGRSPASLQVGVAGGTDGQRRISS